MKRIITLFTALLIIFVITGCSNGKDTSGGDMSADEVNSKLIGTWENVYEVDQSQFQNTDDTTVKVKSVNTTYTFADDGTYTELITNIIEENGTESTSNISDTSGTFITTGDSIRLSPDVINGMSKTDLIESSQNSTSSSSLENSINDPTFGFSPIDLTVTFTDDNTMTLSGLPGDEDLTFTKVLE